MSQAHITGLGIVSPIGIGQRAFLEAIRTGRVNAGPMRWLDVEGFRIGRGGEVADDAAPWEVAPSDGRCLAFALHACREAIADAGLESAPDEATLAVGCGAGEMRNTERALGPPEDALPIDHGDPLQPPNVVTSKLARRLGLHGRTITFVNACAAGAQAIGVAADLIRAGRAQVAIAGGVEVLNRMVTSGFEALRAVSPTGCHPFDADRDGILLSELAAFVVLESDRRIAERGARSYGRVAGSGASADAFHVVQPDSEGAGAVLALRRALADAGLEAEAVDYVNAHGTGTVQNDPAELAALRTVFGERAARLPISSTKGMLGHALGASGAAEVVICALALRDGFLPATVGWGRSIEGYEGYDFITEGARPASGLRHILSSAFAFGGNNVVLALSAPVVKLGVRA